MVTRVSPSSGNTIYPFKINQNQNLFKLQIIVSLKSNPEKYVLPVRWHCPGACMVIRGRLDGRIDR